MSRRRRPAARILIVCAVFLAALGRGYAQLAPDYDVVVYGESSAGVLAAVEAARLGKSTVLIARSQHVGGMTASGLGATDVGNAATIGGLALTFYQNIYNFYHGGGAPAAAAEAEATATNLNVIGQGGVQFDFEPHVAESVFLAMLHRAGAICVFGEQLDRTTGVVRRGNTITLLRMKSGRSFSARVFIDATYEGDLLAAAGVRYRVGRESREAYGESMAGVFRDNELTGEVDPYRVQGDPSSGVLPGVSTIAPGPDGSGDNRIQQYNFRLCLTNVPSNRLPIEKPATYDRNDYELLARRFAQNPGLTLADVVKVQTMPGGKADINANASFSTDLAGDESTQWPEASDAQRIAIFRRYCNYTAGLFWFLSNDPVVPTQIQTQAAQWGLAADEFTDNGNWPWQLYVREARRMVGAYLITQHDCDGEVLVSDPVALASYAIDSHKTTLFVDGSARLNTEGFMFHGVNPYPISYRALIPSASECTNLLVPVCLSATHVAFNSIRMEPVFMMLGHAAGAAASLAVDENTTVQSVNYAALAQRLRADRQILSWPTATGSELYQDQPEQPEIRAIRTLSAPRKRPAARRTPNPIRQRWRTAVG